MAEWLNLDHFDLGTFVDYVHALKQERDALRAQLPSQGGEAVEVVASIAVDAEGVVRDFTLEPGLDRHPGGYTVTPLMTVAQHQRILAASVGSAQPDGWHTEDHLTDKSATTYDPEVAKRWRAKGWPVTPLYTHPADQVAGVRLDGLVLANLQMGRVYLHFKTTEQQHAALRELRALLNGGRS